MATKVRAVSCNVVRKNNPASKKSKCGCPKKNPTSKSNTEILGYERVGTSWQRKQKVFFSDMPKYKPVVETVWCAKKGDASPTHIGTSGGKGYNSKCSWCYLGYGHTDDEHKRQVALNNPIGETLKKAAKHVGKKAATKGKELGARAGAATKRAAKAAATKAAAKGKEYGSRAAAATKKAAKAAGRKAVEKGKEYGARAGATTKRVAKKAAAKGAEVGKRAAKRTVRKVAGTARGAAAGLMKGWKENPSTASIAPMTLGKFTFDVPGSVFPGYTDGSTWNGWAVAYVTTGQVRFLDEAMRKLGGKAYLHGDNLKIKDNEGHIDTIKPIKIKLGKMTRAWSLEGYTLTPVKKVPIKVTNYIRTLDARANELYKKSERDNDVYCKEAEKLQEQIQILLDPYGMEIDQVSAPNPVQKKRKNPVRSDSVIGLNKKRVQIGIESGAIYAGKDAAGKTVTVGQYHQATDAPGKTRYAIFLGNSPTKVSSASVAAAHFIALVRPDSVELRRSSHIPNPAKRRSSKSKRNPVQDVRLPSEEDGGKPSHDKDFAAGFAAGKKALKTNANLSVHDAKSAFGKVKGHGSWWTDGFIAAIDLHRGAHKHKGVQIAKRMGLVSTLKQNLASKTIPAAERPAWKAGLRKDLRALGLKSGQKYNYQGRTWLVYDFDADSRAPGGATLVLVSSDFTKTVRGVRHEVSTLKQNPSKDQIHLSYHNKRWYVLFGQDWLWVTDSKAKELLSNGAVKVPWSHGKLVHHAPGKLVEDRALGLMMHNWHSGQGDSIYGVGSLLFAEQKPTVEAMQDALSNIQYTIHNKNAKFNNANYKELKLIENNLMERISRAQGRKAVLGNPTGKPVNATELNVSTMEEALVTGGGLIRQVRATDAPHIRRCIKAGLLEPGPERGTWRATAAGAARIEKLPAVYRYKPKAPRGQLAEVIPFLKRNPTKKPSKTCKQTVTDIRTGRTVTRSLPHIVPEWDASGYARCEACGQDIYVGQGPRSPAMMQVEEGEYLRQMMLPKRNPTKKPAGGIPKVQIEYIVGNIHVGEPDEVVRKNIEDRARKAGATDKLVKACGDYAVKVHQRNRNLYNDVMGGRIGSGRRRKNPARGSYEAFLTNKDRLRHEYPDLAAEADYHAETSPSFTRGKIGAVSITLTRTEGGNHDLNEPHHVTGKDVWGKANALLSLWGAEAAVGARNKVKFVVHYSDKETYTGSYHVSRADKDSAHLGRYIRQTIEAVLGKRKPQHMSAEKYNAKIATIPAASKQKWARFLATYSTGNAKSN
jgi:hypothetical protein